MSFETSSLVFSLLSTRLFIGLLGCIYDRSFWNLLSPHIEYGFLTEKGSSWQLSVFLIESAYVDYLEEDELYWLLFPGFL
ncbi:hypothetical protein U1Q18_029061 [Sarracenia purpurea var. burkii]